MNMRLRTTLARCLLKCSPILFIGLCGCDGSVLDIIAGSLQLAFGIVEAAS